MTPAPDHVGADGCTPIDSIVLRERVTLRGTLQSLTYPSPNGPRAFVATLVDGDASIELRWPGRYGIPGVHVGDMVEVEGVAGRQNGRITMINPLYRLISREST